MSEHRFFRFVSAAFGAWLMYGIIIEFGNTKPGYTVDAELLITGLFVMGIPFALGYFSREGKLSTEGKNNGKENSNQH